MNETQKQPLSRPATSLSPKPIQPAHKPIVSTAPMQGNLSIDFTKKNNAKPPYRSKKPLHSQGPKMTSEAFLRHRDAKIAAIDDPRKLIKKGETPVKIGSLLGLQQVGQCMFIEYQNDLLIIDAGMEFAAAEELGADYIIPDISYLKKNKHKIKGILLTHGHLDHIGALRHMLPELDFPMIYTTPLTLGIIKKTFDDPKEAAKIKYKLVDPDVDILKLGCFTIEFVLVNHNIPETMALSIYTPKGLIFDSSDFKIDYTPAVDKPADLARIGRIGIEGVKLYIGDSLGTKKAGRGISEKVIGKTLDDIIKGVEGRIFVATFASNVGRVIQIINSAIRYNKVVFLSGRSMVNLVDICQHLGYITVPKQYIRKLDNEVNTMPDNRVLVLSTGAQGEEFAALTRMSRNEHNIIKIKKGDTILMSSSAIPGNESAMKKMFDELVIKDINLITNKEMDVHASGHGGIEDHKLFLNLLKPNFFLPYFMPAEERYDHKKIALDMGMHEDRILMPNINGHIIEMYDDVVLVGEQQLKLDTVMIDGKGQGHLSGEYVVKARHIMAQNGVISLIFKVDTKSNELVGNIQIESRGFVYSSEVKSIHTQVVEFARAKYNEHHKKRMDIKDNLKQIKDDLGDFISKIIGRVPMLLPMYVYINRETQNGHGDVTSDEAVVGMTLDEQGRDD
ncbi:MAG: ribonuclease J [Candidatus Absconditabacterales bacterium]